MTNKGQSELLSLKEEDRIFVEKIFSKYPEWRGSLSFEKDGSGFCPSIRIHSPARGEKRDLILWSDSANGPSISFGAWHDHLDLMSEVGPEADYNELFRLISAILSDELVLFYDKDKATSNPYPQLIEIKISPILQSEKKAKILSWTGAFDR